MRKVRTLSNHARQRGFTLIEIMVVVVILGILGAFAVSNIFDSPDQARITKAHHDLREIERALEMYKMHNFNYPTTEQGLQALVEKPTIPPVPPKYQPGGYMRKLPKDPWGNDYQYLGPQDAQGRAQVFTLGSDNQPGGEGMAADISNLDL